MAPVMTLERQLRSRLEAFTRGEVPLGELRRWLRLNLQALATSAGETFDLYDLARALIAEYSLGDRSEESVRTELAAALGEPSHAVAGPLLSSAARRLTQQPGP